MPQLCVGNHCAWQSLRMAITTRGNHLSNSSLFVILDANRVGGCVLNFFKYLQFGAVIGFFICIGLYTYFMSQRMRKKVQVDFQLWLIVAIGLLLNVIAQLSGLGAGSTTWAKISVNVSLTGLVIIYAVWRVYKLKAYPIQVQPYKKQQPRFKGAAQASKRRKGK